MNEYAGFETETKLLAVPGTLLGVPEPKTSLDGTVDFQNPIVWVLPTGEHW